MSDRKEQQQGDPGAVPGASTTTKGLKTQGKARCYVCGSTPRELRPYGADGQPICFPCMTSDPAREEEAARQFGRLLDAAGPVAVIGSPDGPRPIRWGSDGPQEDPFARLEEKFRSLEQLVRHSARAIDQLLAGHRAVRDEDAETLVPVPLRPGICSTCANGGAETVLGLIWCCRCDGTQCGRCCGSFLHRLDAVRIERMVVGNLGTAILGVIRIRQEAGGADRYEGRARFASEPVEAYFSVGNRTLEAAWENVLTWVAAFEGGAR